MTTPTAVFDWADLLERTAWTAIQTLTATITLDTLLFSGSAEPWKALAISAGAAVLSAIKTIAKTRLAYLRDDPPAS